MAITDTAAVSAPTCTSDRPSTQLTIGAPIVSWVLGLSLVHVGALTAAVSVIAMVWNVAFNALFERTERRYRLTRTLGVRAAHAVEFGLGRRRVAAPSTSR
uniref:chlorhexidine efflux transporter n=1 Tax=Burkholderia pseudomallei TaxID=28450 RepID=UPI00358E6E94